MKPNYYFMLIFPFLVVASPALALDGDTWRYPATVERVIDGDTFVAKIELGLSMQLKRNVIVLGYDAPERGAPGFAESRDALKDALQSCKEVWIVTDSVKQVDGFGRVLAHVFCDDIDVAETLK